MEKISSNTAQDVRGASIAVVAVAILVTGLASATWWYIFSRGEIGRLELVIDLFRMSPIRVLVISGIVLIPTVVGPLLCACSIVGISGIFLRRLRSEAAVYSLIIMSGISLFISPIGWLFLFFSIPH